MKSNLLLAIACCLVSTSAFADYYLILKKPGQDPFVVSETFGSHEWLREYNCEYSADLNNAENNRKGYPGYYYCSKFIPRDSQNRS